MNGSTVWIELITTSTRLDRFVQLSMIMAHREFNEAEKDEFNKLYKYFKELC